MAGMYWAVTLNSLRSYIHDMQGQEANADLLGWLGKMIARDELVASINTDKLHESGIWDNLVATGWNSSGVVKVGDLRQANLSTTQLEYAKVVLQEVANKQMVLMISPF